MKTLDDFRLQLGTKKYVPIVVGGMGTDISTKEMALVVARLGGIGHLSDAMIPVLADRYYGTQFSKNKLLQYKSNIENQDKSLVQFELESLEKAIKLYVEDSMSAKRGEGDVFINVMEKLTMNNPRGTLEVRLSAAMDAGIDGITLSAGLHLGSLSLIENHPRFRDTKIGIIVSSVRALKLFLIRAGKLRRMPDFIVVEGPLAGGHLGFGMDWAEFNLNDIFLEVMQFLKKEGLSIPVIPAGGIFTGTDGVEYMGKGAAAIQVATRFVVAKESGLTKRAKQAFFQANEEDIEVNQVSPTGYPMRMLKQTPAIGSGVRPNCESLGYLLNSGKCSYIDEYYAEKAKSLEGKKVSVKGKTCLCTHMQAYNCWTCGHLTYRLKDTTNQLSDGSYQELTSEHIFLDYQHSADHQIKLPDLPKMAMAME